MKLIALTQGYNAMVDDEDYDKAIKYSWHVSKRNGNYYARYKNVGATGSILLHRLVMGNPVGQVDHIDGNGLNCQKYNLRLATHGQQMANRGKFAGTKYKGIHPNGASWQARLYSNGKWHITGRHKTPEDAARAYDELAKQYHGEFARLNFP